MFNRRSGRCGGLASQLVSHVASPVKQEGAKAVGRGESADEPNPTNRV